MFNDSPVAIYRQLIEYYRYEIASGRIKPGERLDSIRNIALQFKVNPNTVQKALVELERDGLVHTHRTNGKFVTEDQTIIDGLHHNLVAHMSEEVVKRMKDLNATPDEVLDEVRRMWKEN